MDDVTGPFWNLYECRAPLAAVLDVAPPPRPKGTGLVYDERLKRHHCPIGSKHGQSECPERLSVCMERLQSQGLSERCIQVPLRPATDEEILSLHSKEYLDTLKKSSTLPPDELKKLAESYDSIFMCSESYELAALQLGGLLNLTEKVVKGELRNGFAVTRPPGHHAQYDIANGYSLLNAVALAAKISRTKWNVDRVLIVDWDVHHGQGVQFLFEDDPSVLYFSMHRYGNLDFWPHLKDSNYDHIGRDAGVGFNINIPWNKTGMGDAEYLAMFHQLLLPIAHEFKPKLVLVCAGFDSASGDPMGEMSVSPPCYAHLTHMLMSLAEGKVVLNLEGGYNLAALGESAAWCTGALLGDHCPPLPPMGEICESAKETLRDVTKALKPHWKCLRCGISPARDEEPIQIEDVSSTTPDEAPVAQGEGVGVMHSTTDVDSVADRLMKELTLSKPPHRTGLVYDERMKLHKTFNHPERPERIARIFSKHQEHGLVDRCLRIEAREATEEEIATCHLRGLIDEIKQTSNHTARELIDMQEKFNPKKYSREIYVHPDTYLCALLAAGSVLNLVDAVLTNRVLNAVAIVRPPGHHADCKMASGFCFFNNVAIASKYAQNKFGVKRILIVDWDVHHGNGTQRLLESDPSVMYISLHRHDDGSFYPTGPEGGADYVGKGNGRGFNINIGWNTENRGCMGDAEYMAAFHRIVMPLAYQFNPELVFISAGFDAAKGDPLGGCLVSPECYGHMTQLLSSVAGGRVITVLEGGYNLLSIAVSMAMCTRVMLGDPCPDIFPGVPHSCGVQAIYDVAKAHSSFWSSMKLQVGLLETMVHEVPDDATTSDDVDSPLPAGGTRESEDNVCASSSGHKRVEEVSSTQEVATVIPGVDGADDKEKKQTKLDGDAVEELLQGVSQLSIEQSSQKSAKTVSSLMDGCGDDGGDRVMEEEEVDTDAAMTSSPHTASAVAMSAGGGDDTSQSMTTQDENDDEALGACGWTDPGPKAGRQGLTMGDLINSVNSSFGPDVQMHAVIPQPWCPHLESGVQPLPPEGLDAKAPCQGCGDVSENWVCLQCYQVHCGRYVNEHMLMHGLETEHLLVLSYADLSVWCYGCDAYIHNEVLIPAKRAAHISKFGVDIPGV